MLSQTLFQGLLLWKKIGEGNVVYCPNLNKTQDINVVNTVKATENMKYNFGVRLTCHCQAAFLSGEDDKDLWVSHLMI